MRSIPDGDFGQHFFSFIIFQQQEILAGHLPIWNPFTFSGHPFLADIQSAVFYPVSTALLLLTLPITDPAARYYLLEVEVIVHVALAGVGMYLFVSWITGARTPGVFAGICFAFSGYLTGYPTSQLAVIRTAVWLPLILYASQRALTRPSRWRWWLAAGLYMSFAFLGGHAQTYLYILYFVAGWILLHILAALVGRGKFLAAVPLFIGGGIVLVTMLGLVAAQLLPALEFAALSVRAQVDYAYVSGGFPVRDTWQLLLPGVFTWYSPLYIGVPGLLLAAMAVVTLPQRRALVATDAAHHRLSLEHWYVFFFAAGAVLALLVAYGEHGFLYGLFYKYLPGWDRFRGQERAAFVVTFSVSALAGIGAHRLHALSLRMRRRFVLVAAASIATLVYVFGIWWQLLGDTAISNWRYLVIAALTIAVAMVVLALVWLSTQSTRRKGLLLVLTVANLFVVNNSISHAAGSPADRVRLAPEIMALLGAMETNSAASPIRGRVYNEFRVYDDYGMRTRIEDVWGSSPLKLAKYASLMSEFPLDRMWQLTGVEYVLTWRKELFVPSTMLAEFAQQTDTTYLHRLTEHNPRAWVVSKLLPRNDHDALDTLANHGIDLGEVAVVDISLPEISWPAGQSRTTMHRIASNRLQVQVESEEGGLLVVTENWMPGWYVVEITCSGVGGLDACQPQALPSDDLQLFTPIRVNHTFIGIPVPPGQILFELVYQPISLLVGLSVSTLTLLIIGLLWVSRPRQIRSTVSTQDAKVASSIIEAVGVTGQQTTGS